MTLWFTSDTHFGHGNLSMDVEVDCRDYTPVSYDQITRMMAVKLDAGYGFWEGRK